MSPIRLPVMASHACASANVVLPPFIRNHIPSPHQPHNTTTRTLTAHSHMCARPLAPSGCIVDRQWGGQCSARSHAVTHAVALTPLHTGTNVVLPPFIRNHIPSPHQPHNTTTRTLTAHSHMCARPLAPSGCIVDRQWGGQCSARSHAVTHAVALTPLHTGGVTAIRPRSSVLLGSFFRPLRVFAGHILQYTTWSTFMEQVQQVHDVGPNRDATCKRLAVERKERFGFQP